MPAANLTGKLVFDPTTYDFLGFATSSALLEVGIVDRVGQRPRPRRTRPRQGGPGKEYRLGRPGSRAVSAARPRAGAARPGGDNP
ncbi:hypothetical protein [Goodfellowiella coeruleoviolacea]|uniref:hypothetical protein n=1 Tax=Goodfellowiella coeruleoviolacea TaxID=334858 RepID=UPI0020A2F95B|nr:hypothetical protein [Goodfellowiella coeruleoviolacea]